MHTPIAIVGMACQYPDASTPEQLWQNVLACRQSFRRLPGNRTNLDDYYSADRTAGDHTYGVEAAVIADYHFDRARFRVSGSTYRATDLTHWLALDTAARALADAGFAGGDGLPRPATGVYLGNTLTGEFSRSGVMRLRWPYVRRVVAQVLSAQGMERTQAAAMLTQLEAEYKRPFAALNEDSLAGGLANTIAGRICNHFDLGGGGYTVDGACSSSLLAVGTGCRALVAGELEVALVGGVDLSLDPFELIGFARAGALSGEDMRIYDSHPAGFLPGEGCGVLVLMRLAEAMAQGRRVYAAIHGWGISSDGGGGLTRPEVEGQLRALRRAYAMAGFGPESIAYFEGHGTGTAVGDQVELTSLSRARREAGGGDCAPAALGSIKANIGHTKAAAGVAGLIKTTLALHHQILPPTTGCPSPHRELEAEEAVLRVLSEPEAWPTASPLRAAVSAMGFGGINAHVVLAGVGERRPPAPPPPPLAQDAELVLLAGHDRADLQAQVDHLLGFAARLSRAEVADLAAHLSARLAPVPLRAALVVTSPTDLASALGTLRDWLRSGVSQRLDPRAGIFLGAGHTRPRLGLLFPGQGSATCPHGGALARRFPAVRHFFDDPASTVPADATATEVAQPQIVAASLAALAVLDDLGITADLAIGHSLGELAALHWGGALDAPDLQRLTRERARAMALQHGPVGAMASIATDPVRVAPLLTAATEIACCNSPLQTVIAGERGAVARVVALAQAEGLTATVLKVSHAFHSPLMAGARPQLEAALAACHLAPLRRPLISTVTGQRLDATCDLRALLSRQLTAPVRFQEAVAAAGAVDLWIEAGPAQVLSRLLPDCTPTPALSVAVGDRSLWGLLAVVGAAFALGAPVRPAVLFAGRSVHAFDLDWRPQFFTNPCEEAPPLFDAPSSVEPVAAPMAEPATVSGASVYEIVRELVAARVELPAQAVEPHHRLLSDLHLNSITVAQLAGEAARALDLAPLAAPTEYANATVAELAAVLEELRQRGEVYRPEHEPAVPPGLDAWIAAFRLEYQRRPARPIARAGTGKWKIFASTGHPLAPALQRRFVGGAGEGGIVVCLPPQPDERQVELLLAATGAVAQAPAGTRFVLVHQEAGGGGFARTLHLEHPKTPTRVVSVPFDHPEAAHWVFDEATGGADGFVEAHYDREGQRTEPLLVALDLPETTEHLPLGPQDVLLVSGGGRGIAAECALALARHCGVRLVLLGRSYPEAGGELAANLERLAVAGVQYRYLAVDVSDGAAVRTAVAAVEAEWGPVTGLLHSAGQNVPQLLDRLDAAAFRRTLAPKLGGLRQLLAAIRPEHLKLLVGFGSIIARSGMQGEADYATANEWLTSLIEDWQHQYPHCRCLAVEWSVWSGVGMGERLGRLAALAQEGIVPIPPDVGVQMLLRLLSHPSPEVAVVVAGRLGRLPTLQLAQPELPFLRFLERVQVYYPGIELVCEADLSAETDPYLADHVFQGDRILPGVLGLEAMAQAVGALAGRREAPVFEQVQFLRPVVVPEQGGSTVRLCVLARGADRYDVVLRSADSRFQANHMRAVCRFGHPPRPAAPLIPAQTLALLPERDLYGATLFHRGRFRRLQAYRHLGGTGCLAQVALDGHSEWFGPLLPDTLVLGDPGSRDTVIHAIQGCLPHAVLLPIGVERLESADLREARGPLFVQAKERFREANSLFVYDLLVIDSTGRVLEVWEGLRLQRIAPAPARTVWPAALVAPYVENRLRELVRGPALAIHLAGYAASERPERSRLALQTLLGRPIQLSRRPDGRPEVAGSSVSASHCGPWTLAVAGSGTVGCDLERARARTLVDWQAMLGPQRVALAELIAHESGEPFAVSATRVWTATECLRKSGAIDGTALVLQAVLADGWVTLGTEEALVATVAVHLLEETGDPHVLGLLVPGASGGPGATAVLSLAEKE